MSFVLCLISVGVDMVHNVSVIVEIEPSELEKEKESEKESDKTEKDSKEKKEKRIAEDNLLILSAIYELNSNNYLYQNMVCGFFGEPSIPPPKDFI